MTREEMEQLSNEELAIWMYRHVESRLDALGRSRVPNSIWDVMVVASKRLYPDVENWHLRGRNA